MTKLYCKINKETGAFLEDVIYEQEVIIDQTGNKITKPIPSDLIPSQPVGLYKPRWDGTKWVEGYVPTLEEVKERINSEQKVLRKELMRTGKEYLTTGVVVPFTGDDSLALIQVKNGFDLGNSRTTIHWSNGEKLLITPDELLPLMRWFSYERNQFYLD